MLITFSCRKPKDVNVIPNSSSFDLTQLPAKFSQNALLEEFTATWCGYCPNMPPQILPFVEANPDRVFLVAYQQGDDIDPSVAPNDQATQMASHYGVSGIPDYCANRVGGTSYNPSWLNNQIDDGLAISTTLNGKVATVNVYAGFKTTVSAPLVLTVLVIEDKVIADQHNYMDGDVTSPFYGMGNPIPNYDHHGCFRKALTNVLGDAIPSIDAQAGKIYTKSFTVDLSAYNLANCKVIAMIHKASGNAVSDGITNFQMAPVGKTTAWN